jgi:carbon monoxide dehydrogenase subunit G
MVLAAASLVVALSRVMADAGPAPTVTVREQRGVYSVSARFHVAEPPAMVLAVLTDYDNIPRFLPDVTSSVVRERSETHVVVEQEAVSRMMMFSKKVHLLLDISEEAGVIRFRDRCGRSFEQYDGAWRVTARGTGSDVAYELTANPSFDVPEFLLKRLLKRDSLRTIERLGTEISERARRVGSTPRMTLDRVAATYWARGEAWHGE